MKERELAHSTLEQASNSTPYRNHHFGHHAACRTDRLERQKLKLRTLSKQQDLQPKIDSSESPK